MDIKATNSAVIEARADIRMLARIHQGLTQLGADSAASRSHFVRQIIEAFYDVLWQNELVGRWENLSTEGAMAYLQQFGLADLNRSGRNRLTLAQKLSLERRNEDQLEMEDALALPPGVPPEWWQANLERIANGLAPLPLPEEDEDDRTRDGD